MSGSLIDSSVLRPGTGIPGANISILTPLATTAAAVSSNLATFTMSSNPITAGFAAGQTLLVAGFTGGDTFFNAGSISGNKVINGYTILSVTSTTVVVPLVHASASAGSNGTLLQMGDATHSGAGLATIYSDASLSTPIANPFTSDTLGNYEVGIAAGIYYVQIYGYGIDTLFKQIIAAGASASTPGGATTNIQFNDGGSFGGDTELTWNKTSHTLEAGPAASAFTSFTQSIYLASPELGAYDFRVLNNLANFGQAVTVEQETDLSDLAGDGPIALQGATITTNSGNINAGPVGCNGEWNHIGTGNITNTGEGLSGAVSLQSAATVTGAIGVGSLVVNNSTGIITNAYGFKINTSNNSSGSITNSYGYYAGALTGTTTTFDAAFYTEDVGSGAHSYAYYSAGGKNLFAGIATESTAISNLIAATNSVNQNSPLLAITGTIWNGSASVIDKWTLQDVVGAGANPTSTLTFVHAGSGGNIAMDFGFAQFANVGTINSGGMTASGNVNISAGSSFTAQAAAGALMTIGQTSELLTLSLASAHTDTSSNLLPANAIIDSVAIRVTTTISGGSTPTTIAVGDAGTSNRFLSTGTALTAGSTGVGLNQIDAGTSTQASAAKVRITLDQIPGQGAVRITSFWRTYGAPTA